VKHWPILIILARDIKKKRDANDYSFGHLILILSLYTTLWSAEFAV